MTDKSTNLNIPSMKENVQMWLKDHQIKGFYLANQSSTFEEGAKNCFTMAGLGKLSPNLVMMGFKSDWKSNLALTNEYLNAIYCAFDQKLSLTILRVKGGFDYSGNFSIL